MRFVILVNGIVLMAMAALMGLVAILFHDASGIFQRSLILTGLVGALVAVASGGANTVPRPLHGFVVTASVWMTAAIAGAIPLWLWRLGAAAAFFESMSGITTTGATVIVGLDAAPHGILFWRALLQAIGGIGFIVTGVALLPLLRVGGMQLFRTESSEKGEKEFASAARFAVATLIAYALLMSLCAFFYGLGGMSVFDAATHAMTTLSTGGYSNYDASFGHFDSPYLHCVAAIFMLCGGLPFAWYIRVALKRHYRSEQVRGMVLFVLVVSAMLTVWQVLSTDRAPEEAFRQSLFNVISVVTTTGYATEDYTAWGPFAVAVFFCLTLVGGCTGSTSGGAKIMRWIVFFRATGREVRRLYSPHMVTAARYEGRPIGDDVVSGVMAFFALYFGSVVVLSSILEVLGLDALTAISGAMTALANVGPGVGPVIGPAGNFESIGAAAQLALAGGMYIGRLELLTVLVLILPAFWREV